MTKKKIYEFVKERREELGLSQRALAKKAGISPSALSRLEAGDVIPNTQTLDSLAKALNVPLAKMLNIVQGRLDQTGKDTLLGLIEQLPEEKRKLAEDIIRLLLAYNG